MIYLNSNWVQRNEINWNFYSEVTAHSLSIKVFKYITNTILWSPALSKKYLNSAFQILLLWMKLLSHACYFKFLLCFSGPQATFGVYALNVSGFTKLHCPFKGISWQYTAFYLWLYIKLFILWSIAIWWM